MSYITGAGAASIGDLTTKDHDLLDGLTDDDHTQYALLAGRGGGQTLVGGSAAGDDLLLRATSDATPGDIIFESEPSVETMRILSTGELALGVSTLSGSELVRARKDQDGVTEFRLENLNAPGTSTRAFYSVVNSSSASIVTGVLGPSHSGINGILSNEGFVQASTLSNGLAVGTQGADNVRVVTNSVERVRVLSTGEHLVGTTTKVVSSVLGEYRKDQSGRTVLAVTNDNNDAGNSTRAEILIGSTTVSGQLFVTPSNNTEAGVVDPSTVHFTASSGGNLSMKIGTLGTGDFRLITGGDNTRLQINDNGDTGLYGVTPVAQAAKISDPSGGATVDAEARTAINAIIDALEGIGISASV